MRIVVAEDHRMFREVVVKACRELGHEIVGETDSGAQAVELVLASRPEVLVLDLFLTDIDGFAVSRELLQSGSATRILALSAHCEPYVLFQVEKAPFHGFVDKNTSVVAVLREALDALATGGCYFSAFFQSARRERLRNPDSFQKVLTDWECEILCLIGYGISNEEIGSYLGISARTVQTHRSIIMTKLGIRNTPKLMAFAIQNGFTQLSAARLPFRSHHSR